MNKWTTGIIAVALVAAAHSATQTIRPQTDGDAGLGTASHSWGAIHAKTGSVEYLEVSGTSFGDLAGALDALEAETNDWNTAHADRLKWDGGGTGLNAATGRTSLGLGTAAQSNATAFVLADTNKTIAVASVLFTNGWSIVCSPSNTLEFVAP